MMCQSHRQCDSRQLIVRDVRPTKPCEPDRGRRPGPEQRLERRRRNWDGCRPARSAGRKGPFRSGGSAGVVADGARSHVCFIRAEATSRPFHRDASAALANCHQIGRPCRPRRGSCARIRRLCAGIPGDVARAALRWGPPASRATQGRRSSATLAAPGISTTRRRATPSTSQPGWRPPTRCWAPEIWLVTSGGSGRRLARND